MILQLAIFQAGQKRLSVLQEQKDFLRSIEIFMQHVILKKTKEWVAINRMLLEIYQISGFLFAIKDMNNVSITDIPKNTFSICYSNLNNLLLFSGNIFRIYAITEINKIVNPDSYPQSVTLFSFMNEFYPDKNSEQWKKFGEWKKKTKSIRGKINKARMKFSSHLDKNSIHGNIFFDLSAEKIDDFIKDTFVFFNFLYITEDVLKKSFNKEINPGLVQKEPLDVAEKWRNIMMHRIISLQQCCLEKDKK